MRKGQGSTEYLLVLGVAVIIGIIVINVSGVNLTGFSIINEKRTNDVVNQLKDVNFINSISETGEIQLLLKSNLMPVNVESYVIYEANNSLCNVTLNSVVSNSNYVNFKTNCTNVSGINGETYEYNYVINYVDNNKLEHSISGELKGVYELITDPMQLTSYNRACENVDVCTWDTILPLGSQNCCSCNLEFNTLWNVSTQKTVTCRFNKTVNDYNFFVSIDNDVLNCTLNDNVIMNTTSHEGCAPTDPRNGYRININPTIETNIITCAINDRGSMSHFDACLTPNVPLEVIEALPSNSSPVEVNSSVIITFSNVIDSSTIQSIKVIDENHNIISGSYSLNSNIVTFKPSNNLSYNTVYTVSVNNVRDVNGNTLSTNYFFSFNTINYSRSCASEDVCTWDVLLPLGSSNCCSCPLGFNTLWNVNTLKTVTCNFNKTKDDYALYISIDNDVLNCTLNDNVIMNTTSHEGCAPTDPRAGYAINITPIENNNTITCVLNDRGSMSHFDACLT